MCTLLLGFGREHCVCTEGLYACTIVLAQDLQGIMQQYLHLRLEEIWQATCVVWRHALNSAISVRTHKQSCSSQMLYMVALQMKFNNLTVTMCVWALTGVGTHANMTVPCVSEHITAIVSPLHCKLGE